MSTETCRTGALSCTACNTYNCSKLNKEFPAFCLTTISRQGGDITQQIEEVTALYREDPFVSKIARAAAEIEGEYYGKYTRAEEIVAFAKRIEAKKVGIATCGGLINEAKIFVKILTKQGLESFSVMCKVGAVHKAAIGIEAKYIRAPRGSHVSICNPVLQAKLLNQEGTDLNVVIGLCVGHDALFTKYSAAPVTTLIAKDRVLGHNPAAALYTTCSYYKKLVREENE
ncbi:MAG: DUF1847 domain-containing protein [Bacillota bacterium]|nr:hypothetical protein [Bacillota bacterium]